MSGEAWMKRALDLAQGSIAKGGGPFGAVIVRDGRIVAEGTNAVTSTPDPTAHAEMVAIRAAALTLGSFDLAGCAIYTSCEPCPMCLGAIYWARLDRIWFAATRDDAAAAGFDDEFLYREIPKPLADRLIPTARLKLAETDAVFRAWAESPNKIPY